MNSKIVTFAGYYSHSVKNCCILENKIYYKEKKITWNFLPHAGSPPLQSGGLPAINKQNYIKKIV